MSNINTWYEFVLQQMAAESYLEGVDLTDIDAVTRQLELGNNRTEPSNGQGGYTRMTEVQAKGFLDHYEIVDQLPNTSSGFSATLIKSKRNKWGQRRFSKNFLIH